MPTPGTGLSNASVRQVVDARRDGSWPPHILFVVGARPNFMKVAPVYRALKNRPGVIDATLLHTGQHYDAAMSEVFFADLDLPPPDVHLHVGSGSHASQTARALEGVAEVLERDAPDLLVVAGDVNSTLAAALAAAKLNIPIAHIESGLRSWDWTMPEEHNRRLTDHLSTLLFSHSEGAVENLRAEGIDEDSIFLVGNTMIDSLHRCVAGARSTEPWRGFGLTAQSYGLVTLHRPALVDDFELLARTMAALRDVSEDFPVLFPMHPRTRARLTKIGQPPGAPVGKVTIAEPVSYREFLGLQLGARFVITDSGGVQEETAALGVPCFTLRDTTERPVTIELGTNTLLGLDPSRIREIPRLLDHFRPPTDPIPFWDGHAGERCASVLHSFLSAGKGPRGNPAPGRPKRSAGSR
jgi:UDP-N-acetylglucosamine 2-epimerase (non-hydrolysing)